MTVQTQRIQRSTRLYHPKRLRLARGVWIALALLQAAIFVLGAANYAHELQQGCLCDQVLFEERDGRVILHLHPDFAAGRAIADGDVLLAVDGTPVQTEVEAFLLSKGEVGGQVTVQVQRATGQRRDVTLTRSPVREEMDGALSFGLSPNAALVYALALDSAVMLGFAAVAGLIAWKRSDDWMALFASGMLIAMGLVTSQSFDTLIDPTTSPYPHAPFIVYSGLAYGGISLFGLLFPDGRIAPRWSPLLSAALAVWVTLDSLEALKVGEIIMTLASAGFAVGFISVASYRYRRFFTLVRRQQAKWIISGMASGFLLYLLLWVPIDIVNPPRYTDDASRYVFVVYSLARLALLLIPLTFAFASFRYRLYEVDLVINRGLVYGSLTAALALFFFVVMLLFQQVLQSITGGEQSPVALALASVAISLAFQPMRRFLEHFVDRYLYRLRIDLGVYTKKLAPMREPGALAGKRLGPYLLHELLGRGGMGEVYRARRSTMTQALYAIKVLAADLADSSEFRTRFEREAHTVANLHHPNIVSVIDFGRVDDIYYMVMEFIEGTTLEDYLLQNGRLLLNSVRPLVREIAGALDYAHEKELVHRDVKPANVMLQKVTAAGEAVSLNPLTVSEHFRVVLMDFGITKLVTGHTGLTQTGAIGTLDYMAPEQIMSSREVDRRADVYSLGVMVYQMLTGSLPFRGQGVGQLLFSHLYQPAPDPRIVLPNLPAPIAEAMMRALEKKPEDRHQTAGEFAAALQ